MRGTFLPRVGFLQCGLPNSAEAPVVQHRTPPTHPAAGFSLIEWLITLSVAAVLMAAGVPGLSNWMQRERLIGSASLVASHLHLLRSEALARNAPLRFSLYAYSQGVCTVVHTGEAHQCRCEADGRAACADGQTAVSSERWPASAGIGVSANVASMRFDPDQGTVTPTGSIRVVDGRGAGVTQIVNITGRVRSCSPGGVVNGYAAC